MRTGFAAYHPVDLVTRLERDHAWTQRLRQSPPYPDPGPRPCVVSLSETNLGVERIQPAGRDYESEAYFFSRGCGPFPAWGPQICRKPIQVVPGRFHERRLSGSTDEFIVACVLSM